MSVRKRTLLAVSLGVLGTAAVALVVAWALAPRDSARTAAPMSTSTDVPSLASAAASAPALTPPSSLPTQEREHAVAPPRPSAGPEASAPSTAKKNPTARGDAASGPGFARMWGGD